MIGVGRGHILTGPIFVEGAEPGDALEVNVLSIDLAIDYGYNGCSGFIPANCDRSVPTKIFQLDRKTMTSEFKPGIVIPLAPFFGSMGVAPAPERGRVSSNPPGRHAGNLDNPELVAGSTLYIPVFVPGALFAVGDGHAAQRDGEVSQTAIETSLRGRLQLTVRKGMTLSWPRAETATEYISMGTVEDLKVATTIAIQEMVDFLAKREDPDEARGLSAGQHRRARRHYAVGGQAGLWGARAHAEIDIQVTAPCRHRATSAAIPRPFQCADARLDRLCHPPSAAICVN